MIRPASCAVLLLASPAAAIDLSMPPGAVRTAEVSDPPAPWSVAVSPASPMASAATATLEGQRRRIAWRAPPQPGTGLRLTESLRTALESDGFEVVFTCRTEACGGFDFRADRPVLPMPDMIVDLSGFTYLAARKGPEDAPEALASVLVSEGPAGAFAQMTLVTAAATASKSGGAPTEYSEREIPDAASSAPLGFDARGRMVLDGLDFAPGTATLPDQLPPSVDLLARWLKDNPARRVALVGHTDWTGSADLNRALARSRAAAVADALADRYGIARDRMDVEGVGPFAPRAPNTADAGRAANRRVEAVILSEPK